VPNPEKYTIGFKSDGKFSAKADCNQVAGGYTTTSSGGLTITPGPSTLVACGADSLGDMYVAGLAMAASYSISEPRFRRSAKEPRGPIPRGSRLRQSGGHNIWP
jgi:heat shock protein HslJ